MRDASEMDEHVPVVDEVTGLANRRGFLEMLNMEERRRARYGGSPTLMLVDANGTVVASNDDWKSSQQNEIQATGLGPPNDREAAILTTLPTGNFTAIISGKNGQTGIALVDVFHSF